MKTSMQVRERGMFMFCVCVFFLTACSTSTPPTSSTSSSPLSPAGLETAQIELHSPEGQTIALHVELAISPEERSRGLMYRESLPAGEGMLFLFDEEQMLGFWMQNTLIPLDVLYFDAASAYVSHWTMTPCAQNDPCPSYPSKEPAQFTLEVPAGFAEEQGVGEGWVIEMMSEK